MAKAKRTGTQSIDRVVALLKALSTRRQVGWRLADIAARCELDRATAHRILSALVRHRMVSQRSRDRHYLPGPLLVELALSLTSYTEFRQAYEEVAERLATAVGGIGFFFLLSGVDMVCAARHSVVDALTVEAGMRRPLAGSAGGIAMLILLPEDERQKVVAENFEFIRRYGGDPITQLRRMLRRSEKLGFGINESDLVPNWNTLGLAMRDPSGAPFGSLMIAGTGECLTFRRLDHWVDMLRQEVAQLESVAARTGLWG